jgi:FtsP/CotA-like multicopper oxidase with cupredoxin domain
MQRTLFAWLVLVAVTLLAACSENPSSTRYEISGSVSDSNGAALANVEVTLSGDTDAGATTDASGRFSFSGLNNGDYTVFPRLTGVRFNPARKSVTIKNESVRTLAFKVTSTTTPSATHSIAGTVKDESGKGLKDAQLTLSSATNTIATTNSNADGNYGFSDLTPGTYTVLVTLEGFSFNPFKKEVRVRGSESHQVDFTGTTTAPPPPATKLTISGRVKDANGAGVSEVTITLKGPNGDRTANTASDGTYSFIELSAGNYTLVPSKTGSAFQQTSVVVTLTTENATNIDFTAIPPPAATYTLSGRITNEAGAAIADVTVAVTDGASVLTDGNGDYAIRSLPPGTYTITPTASDYTFEAGAVNITNADVVLNFTGKLKTYTLSGRILAQDTNTPLSGVTVELTGTPRTTATDETGTFKFSGLVNGSYTVRPTLDGYAFEPAAMTYTVNGADVSNVDFTGELLTYSILGKVTYSTTGNPTANVAINVTGKMSTSATTNPDGTFTVTKLVPGDYVVKPSLTGYTFDPNEKALTISSADQNGINFSAISQTPTTYLISGRVTVSGSGAALSGVTVALGGSTSATTTTSNSGDFIFSGLGNGDYTVTPFLSGYTFNQTTLPVKINNANVANVNFQAIPPPSTGRNFNLIITAGTLTVNGPGGAAMPAWSFTDDGGTPKFPGPVLRVNEGEAVTITVTNYHTREHNFVIKGVTTDFTPIPMNDKKVYSFAAPKAGTYLYYDSLNSDINRALGMYGAIIVGPADGSAKVWTDGPAYTFERTWLASDMDKTRWNDVAGIEGIVTTAVYKANYFLINGKGGFDAKSDPAIAINGKVGETALVRILNAGQYIQTFHFHANHVQVLSIDGQRQTAPYKLLDVVTVPPLGTTELLFYLNQPGMYPMHNHTAQMETANGAYLNGVATMINITNP